MRLRQVKDAQVAANLGQSWDEGKSTADCRAQGLRLGSRTSET